MLCIARIFLGLSLWPKLDLIPKYVFSMNTYYCLGCVHHQVTHHHLHLDKMCYHQHSYPSFLIDAFYFQEPKTEHQHHFIETS